jgi:hypothetical protein
VRRCAWAAAVVLLGAGAAGCSSDEPPVDPERIVLAPAEDGDGHTHAPGETDAAPVGDGTGTVAGGYELVDVRLPAEPGSGDLSFRILDERGEPLTDYVEEQTKLLHLYVVRTDLTGFRHLHPALAGDGTWSTTVDLAEPGAYRVIAEFTPGGSEQPVLLGATVDVGGGWDEVPVPTGDASRTGDDGTIEVRLESPGTVAPDGRLQIVVSDVSGAPVTLGSYLGTSAHLTGFETRTGRVVHVHPYGEPEPAEGGTELTFHTTFDEPGDYRFFVQVRVDGFLHTVSVTAPVTASG